MPDQLFERRGRSQRLDLGQIGDWGETHLPPILRIARAPPTRTCYALLCPRHLPVTSAAVNGLHKEDRVGRRM